MRLAVALDLRDFVERLPAGARLGIFRRQRLPGRRIGLDREHPAIRQIAVMRDRQHPSAGLVLIGLEVLPQILRRRAALRRIGRERQRLHRLRGTVAVDHDAMEIVAGRHLRRPFVADEGAEMSGVVVLLGRGDDLVPGRAEAVGARQELQRLRELAAREAVDDLKRSLDSVLPAFLYQIVPAPAGRVGKHFWIACEQSREETHIVRVVGDDQEVERPRQLHALAAGGDQFLASCEPVGVLEAEPGAEGACIERGAGVEMRIAPEHAAREGAAGIRRVAWRFARQDVGGVDRANVCDCRLRQGRRYRKRGGHSQSVGIATPIIGFRCRITA